MPFNSKMIEEIEEGVHTAKAAYSH
jgi:hypothetical protein